MWNRRLVAFALAVVACGSIASCAGQRDRLVERSSGKPGWVDSDRDYWEENAKAYFRGTVDRQATLDLAADRAKYNAIRKINEAVYTKVLSAFGESTLGASNDIDNPDTLAQGNALRRELASVSKSSQLQGVTQEASYWEKYETTTRAGELVVAYKVLSLVSIPVGMLKRAQVAALESGLQKVRGELNEAARGNVEKNIDQLKQEVDQ